MRYFIPVLFFITTLAYSQFQQPLHCGYDFTSYLVVQINEDGKTENITNLEVSIVDSEGNVVINKNNKLSWVKNDQPLTFYENYQIDTKGQPLKSEEVSPSHKWHFPFATASYLLSVNNEFPADNFMLKIEDKRENPIYKTTLQQLYAFNMYVLCTSEIDQRTRQFGRKVNKLIRVIVEKL